MGRKAAAAAVLVGALVSGLLGVGPRTAPAAAGVTMSAATAPLSGLSPPVDPTAPASLGGDVSCPTTDSCVAVGSYNFSHPPLAEQPMIETLAHGAWSALTPPTAGLNPAAGPNSNTVLDKVSCPVSGWCVATGSYADSSGLRYAMIDTLATGAWTAITAPTRGLNPAAHEPSSLAALSCPASGWCVATGSYFDASGSIQGMIDTLAAGAWTAITAPTSGLNPPPNVNNPRVSPVSVSCPKPGSCVAVGSYDVPGQKGLIESLAGGTWTATTAPLGDLNPPGHPNAALTVVSCWADGSCVAVGYSYGSALGRLAVVATLAAGTWSTITVPTNRLDPVIGPDSSLYSLSVSCPADGSCVAVGYYTDGSNLAHGLIERVVGGTWSATTAPSLGLNPPPGANPFGFLRRVSCPSAGSCVAIGGYEEALNNQHAMIETLSAGTWTATTAPTAGLSPPAANPGLEDLEGLSCPAQTVCVAVGSYLDSVRPVDGLIETISVVADTATFTNPLDGQAGVDTTVAFTWTAIAGAQGYYLAVGTTPGGYDLVNSGVLPPSQTSLNMPDLPAGVTLYATVLTEVNGTWRFQVVAFTASVGHATLTTPTAGQTGVNTTNPFTWTAIPRAQAYYLAVGTTPGGYDLVNSGVLPPSQTSLNMPDLPAGVTLYATLLTEVNGAWRFQVVAFTAAAGHATFTYPVDGQQNVSAANPFTWTAVAGAQGYYLAVGTTPGGYDVVNSGVLPPSQSSFHVAGLPAATTLYATLVTKVNETWSRFQIVSFRAV